MNKDEFLPFFVPLYRLKELFRQGWVGKVPISEIESVADHSFGVAFLSLILVEIENKLRLRKNPSSLLLNKLEILEKSLVHDLPESQYLDLDRSINELLTKKEYQELKSKLDEQAERKIVSNFDKLQDKVFSLSNNKILPQMNSHNSEEDQFVKVMDNIELYFQACYYIKNKFISQEAANPFMISTLANITSCTKKFLFIEYLFDIKI